MAESLKPCPFCGGSHMYLLRRFDVYEIDYYYVFCNDCKTSFSNEYVEETESSTREWWNNRDERTCTVHDVIENYPELTYEVSLDCGHGVYITNPDIVNFCPRCGARIIQEER